MAKQAQSSRRPERLNVVWSGLRTTPEETPASVETGACVDPLLCLRLLVDVESFTGPEQLARAIDAAPPRSSSELFERAHELLRLSRPTRDQQHGGEIGHCRPLNARLILSISIWGIS
jgi:hypothetical protein